MKWLRQLFGSSSGSGRRVTASDPLVVESPRLGFLNLVGGDAAGILAEDRAALGPLFASVEEREDAPPACDVLMIYCRLQGDGSLVGQPERLRDIIRSARAPVVIVASENSADSYNAAAQSADYGEANLVMTLDRKGAAFPTFFAGLFGKMFAGTSMLAAWMELAPQVPGATHEHCPDTIFLADISHIVFRRA